MLSFYVKFYDKVWQELKEKKYSGTVFPKLFESQFIMKVVIILCQVLWQGLEGLKEKKYSYVVGLFFENFLKVSL